MMWNLGGYDMEEKAARAYDQAALKYWGPSTHINFPVSVINQVKLLHLMSFANRRQQFSWLLFTVGKLSERTR